MQEGASLLSRLTAGKVLFALLLILAAWILLKWMRGFLNRLEIHNARLRFLLRQVEPPVRILIWFGALMIVAEILAPSQQAFLAALGSAALAIGLGMQDLIKNLIGGLVVVADRPYQTGDRIRMGEAYGEVVQIGLRSTKILTPTGDLVTVPNADVLTRLIFNANAGVAECAVTVNMALPHGTDADQLIEVGREVAVSSPYTHLGHKIEVDVDEAESRNMKLTIQAYVYDHRYESAMQTDVLRRATREIRARGLIKSHHDD